MNKATLTWLLNIAGALLAGLCAFLIGIGGYFFTGLDGRVDTIESAVTTLKTDVQTLKTTLGTLEKQQNETSPLKISVPVLEQKLIDDVKRLDGNIASVERRVAAIEQASNGGYVRRGDGAYGH